MANTVNNISLGVSSAKEILINNDPDRVIYLNTADMGIISRLGEVIPKINGYEDTYRKLFTEDGEIVDDITKFGQTLKQLDDDLRECINFLFDYDVCSVIVPQGTMIDLSNGEYNFVIIINTLLELYENTIKAETNKMVTKMKKKTEKYTTQDHKKKGTK